MGWELSRNWWHNSVLILLKIGDIIPKKDFIIHVDGHTRENKKFGVYGFTIREGGYIIDIKQGYLGQGISNFEAEYQAVLKPLEYIRDELDTVDRTIRIFLDNNQVYQHCIGKKDGKLVKKFTDDISGKVEFVKTNGDGVKNAHLLCSSQYSYLHPFPGYIRELEPEGLIE